MTIQMVVQISMISTLLILGAIKAGTALGTWLGRRYVAWLSRREAAQSEYV